VMPEPLRPGDTIGIVGGGQLGRMLAAAAGRLGYRTIVLDPDPACPAALFAAEVIVGPYDGREGLGELARRSGVVTYEFENVPVEPMRLLARACPVYPPAEALEVAQDRVVEKAFLNGIGIATAPWRAVDDAAELNFAHLDLGTDTILKTRRLGYDGKGQTRLGADDSPEGAFEALGGVPAILEGRIAFSAEISVIAARSRAGEVAAFDPAENRHEGGILRRSSVPAAVSGQTRAEAVRMATRILDRLGYVGVIGVEFFVRADGALLVNEIAPRVHNSGHWTEAACCVSQFEQHVRAVAGLPLGDPRRHSDCVMENLIGEDVARVPELLAQSDTMLTLYGKSEARAGRKMGHWTRLAPRSQA